MSSEFSIARLAANHQRQGFDCGNEVLNRYLLQQSTQDRRRNLAQLYVMADKKSVVIGYYTINASSLEYGNLPETQRKKLPRYPIPAAMIGRFAVDKHYQGRGLAKRLLASAIRQVVEMSKIIGIYAIIIDAKDEKAAGFYQGLGFMRLQEDSLQLYLPIATAADAF